MNSTISQKLEYNLLQELYYQDRVGNKEGSVKYYPNNTRSHENTKWQIATKLKDNGYKIWTECRFKDKKGRAILPRINMPVLWFS